MCVDIVVLSGDGLLCLSARSFLAREPLEAGVNGFSASSFLVNADLNPPRSLSCSLTVVSSLVSSKSIGVSTVALDLVVLKPEAKVERSLPVSCK